MYRMLKWIWLRVSSLPLPCRHMSGTDWKNILHTTGSFRCLHVTYFLVLSMVGASTLRLFSLTDGHRLGFIDALFFTVSALCLTGMGTIEMHRFSKSAKLFLILLMSLGGQVFTSAIPLFIRSAVSARSISDLRRRRRQCRSATSFRGSTDSTSTSAPQQELAMAVPSHPMLAGDGDHAHSCPIPLNVTAYATSESMEWQVLSDSQPQPPPPPSPSPPRSKKAAKRGTSMPAMPSLKWSEQKMESRQWQWQWQQKQKQKQAAVVVWEQGKHSKKGVEFEESAADEGLVEHEALVVLSRVVVGYSIAVQGLGLAVCWGVVARSETAKKTLREKGEEFFFFFFFAFFTVVSAFANAGFGVLDDNLVSMQQEWALLLPLIALVLLGNTLYAPTLRALIWVLHKAYNWLGPGPDNRRRSAALAYLLNSPRRCFTHLFPRAETLWLLLTVCLLNALAMADIAALDWNGPVFSNLPSPVSKIVNALFASTATRNAGLNAVNVASFSPPTLLLMIVMMYIVVYPVYLSRERSREQVGGSTSNLNKMITSSKERMIGAFYTLLIRDSIHLVIATFCICLTERNSIREDPLNFSIFNIAFEIVSAYGNVGLSMGYSCALQVSSSKNTCVDVPYSFSGKWSPLGKVFLICVMLLGRHRGLPDELDWAISLPSYK